MKTKHGLLFGFAVIAIAAMFTLAGCDDPNNDSGGGDDGIPPAMIGIWTDGTYTLTITGDSAKLEGDSGDEAGDETTYALTEIVPVPGIDSYIFGADSADTDNEIRWAPDDDESPLVSVSGFGLTYGTLFTGADFTRHC